MTSAQQRNGKILAVVFLTVFLDMLGVGILIPVIPQLLGNPLSPDYLLSGAADADRGYMLLGLLTAVYPLMMFVAAPILGQLSDRYGRKPILAVSILGTGVSYALFAVGILTKNLPLLFLSRAFDGITGGNISVAQAAIADSTAPENRAKSFGMIGAAFGLGFIMGPYIGGKLADPSVLPWFSASVPFWFAMILSFVNVLSVLFFLRETNTRREGGPLRWTKSLRDIAAAARMKDLRSLFLVNFLFQGGFTFFTTFFGVYLIDHLAFTQGNIGDFFAYVGIWIALTQAFVTRKVGRYASETAILRVVVACAGLGVLAHLLPSGWQGLLFVTPLFAVFMGLTQANLMALVSRSAPPEAQGRVLGINMSVTSLSQTIPPVIAGFIAAASAPAVPIMVAGGVMILAGLVFIATHPPGART